MSTVPPLTRFGFRRQSGQLESLQSFTTATGKLKASIISSRDVIKTNLTHTAYSFVFALSFKALGVHLAMAELAGGVGKVVVSTPVDAEVEVTCVSVQVGDRVRKGSVLCQYRPKNGAGSAAVQTLKSPTVGIVRRIGVNNGDVVPPK